MRIPLRRIYRAFPELDRFSDAECERFMELARRRERLGEIGMGLASVAVLFGVLLIMLNVWRVVPPMLPGQWRAHIAQTPALLAPLIVLSLLSGPLAALLVRDAWLRRAIGRNIDLSRCIQCGYSLLGLPVEDASVRCPECGRTSTLAEMRITAEQLMPRAAAPASGGDAARSAGG